MERSLLDHLHGWLQLYLFTQQIDKFQEDLAKVGLSGFAGPEGAGSSVMAKRHNIKSSTEQTAAGY